MANNNDSGSAQKTKDPQVIKRWAEERGGHPAMVKGTGGNDEVGLLRIDFEENGKDENLEEISWDDFFAKMKEKNLTFLYDDKSNDGSMSRFSKLIYDDDEMDDKSF